MPKELGEVLAYWSLDPGETLPPLHMQGQEATATAKMVQQACSLRHGFPLPRVSPGTQSPGAHLPSLVYHLVLLKHMSVQCFCYSKYLIIVQTLLLASQNSAWEWCLFSFVLKKTQKRSTNDCQISSAMIVVQRKAAH